MKESSEHQGIRPEWTSRDLHDLRERAARAAIDGASTASPLFTALVKKIGGEAAFEQHLLEYYKRTDFDFSSFGPSWALLQALNLRRSPKLQAAADAWHDVLMAKVRSEIAALPERHRRFGKFAVDDMAELVDGSTVSIHEVCFENGMVAITAVSGQASPAWRSGELEAAGWVPFASLAPERPRSFTGKFLASTKLHKDAQSSACQAFLERHADAFAGPLKRIGKQRALKILVGTSIISDVNSLVREITTATRDNEWVLTVEQVVLLGELRSMVSEQIRHLAIAAATESTADVEALCMVPGGMYQCSVDGKSIRSVIFHVDHETMLASVKLESDGAMMGQRWVPLSRLSGSLSGEA